MNPGDNLAGNAVVVATTVALGDLTPTTSLSGGDPNATTVAVQVLTPPSSVNGMGTLQAQAEALALTGLTQCEAEPLKDMSALFEAKKVLDAGYSENVNGSAYFMTLNHFLDRPIPSDEAAIRSYIQELVRSYMRAQEIFQEIFSELSMNQERPSATSLSEGDPNATAVAVQVLTPPSSVNGMDTRQAQAEALALTAFEGSTFEDSKYKPLKLVAALHAAREELDKGYSPLVNKEATLDTIRHFHARLIPDKKAPGYEDEIRSYVQDVIRYFIEKQQSAVTGSPSPMEENEPLARSLPVVFFPTGHSDSQGVEPWGGSLVPDAQVAVAQIGIELSQRTVATFQWAQARLLGGGHGPT